MFLVLKRAIFLVLTTYISVGKKENESDYILLSKVQYSKTCVNWPLSKRQKISFQDQLSLNEVKSIAECSKGSILQYFRPSLGYHLSLRSLFCLCLSGRLTQVLLYFVITMGVHQASVCLTVHLCRKLLSFHQTETYHN